MKDFVVWNPWQENAKNMSDMGDEDYKNMICVEAAQATERIVVKAGEKWTSEHSFVVL